MIQRHLFAPPSITRRQSVPIGATFFYRGRPLRIISVHGDYPAAPVIVEELADFGIVLKGQFALWAAAAVMQALDNRLD